MPMTKEQAKQAFDGVEHPTPALLEQKADEIRRHYFSPNPEFQYDDELTQDLSDALISKEDFQNAEQELELLHEKYDFLNSHQSTRIPILLFPIHFLVPPQFLNAMENLRAFDISFLERTQDYPTLLDPRWKIIADELNQDAKAIQNLCRRLEKQECAPDRQTETTRKDLGALQGRVSNFRVPVTLMRNVCQQNQETFKNDSGFFKNYQIALEKMLDATEKLNSALIALYERDEDIKYFRDEAIQFQETQRANNFEAKLKEAQTKFNETKRKAGEQASVPQQPSAQQTQSPSVINNPSLAPHPAPSVQGTANGGARKANISNAQQPQAQPSTTQMVDKPKLDAVIAEIREQRRHSQGWFTKLLSFLGLNLRQTKETLTDNFTTLLNGKNGDDPLKAISEKDLEGYLNRFKEAQEYLEQKRPSKDKADQMLKNAFDYIKGDGSNKTELLPGFKTSKDDLRDPRSQYGFGKEETRHAQVMEKLRPKK